MGCSQSKEGLISDDILTGDGQDFLEKYNVERILGEGEFGVVKLVTPKDEKKVQCAAKILRKGMVFKDNTLYSAIKPKVLQMECKILQTLAGKHYCLKLLGIYESQSVIYIVSDLCSGGDMFHYVGDAYGNTSSGEELALRTEDVSRISYQLFDAVNHCAVHGIIHRDIKPENIMFRDSKKGSPVRLIDFGSSTMSTAEKQLETQPKPSTQANGDILSEFTTFAGSAFYISPEMFQRKYTCKTDVWSAAVSLYVLVAGYPSKDLQKAFNELQNSKDPDARIEQLKNLPNMPEMPDTFFEFMEKALVYRHKKRNDASSLLDCEFIRFHKDHESVSNGSAFAGSFNFFANGGANGATEFNRTESSVVAGAAFRHIQMRAYRKYEHQITTLIASVLQRNDLINLMNAIDVLIASSPEDHMEMQQGSAMSGGEVSVGISVSGAVNGSKTPEQLEKVTNKKRLRIVLVKELKAIMSELGFQHVLNLMQDQAHGNNYSENAYHVALLRQFIIIDLDNQKSGNNNDVVIQKDMDNSMTRRLKKAMAKHSSKTDLNLTSTNHTRTSEGEHAKEQESKQQNSSSVHGNNVWDTIKKQMTKNSEEKSAGMRRNRSAINLNQSNHF